MKLDLNKEVSMARPLPRDQITALQQQKVLKYHCVVYMDDEPYTIFRDEIGPIYSCPSTNEELSDAGVRDTIWMEDGFDTVTNRIMENARPDATNIGVYSHSDHVAFGAAGRLGGFYRS
jgi:hypothetical protein